MMEIREAKVGKDDERERTEAKGTAMGVEKRTAEREEKN